MRTLSICLTLIFAIAASSQVPILIEHYQKKKEVKITEPISRDNGGQGVILPPRPK